MASQYAQYRPGYPAGVTQAIQWFHQDQFYGEVRRILKPGGVLAAWGYHQPEISPSIDPLLSWYYSQILGPYLLPQSKLVDARYQTLSFPFPEINPPDFSMNTTWTFHQLVGMMSSMSPVLAYQAEHQRHPVDEIYDDLMEVWGEPDASHRVYWRLFFKIGRQA